MSRRRFDPPRYSLAHPPSVDTSTSMAQSLKVALFIVVLAAAVTACGDDANDQARDAGPSDDTEVFSDAGADTGPSEDATEDVYEDASVNDADVSHDDADVSHDDADVWADADEELDHQSVLETLSTSYGCDNGYCHGGGGTPDIWGYDKLVGVASECDGNSRVIAGDPEGSLLWQKISPQVDGSDVCGDKMPGAEGISAEDAQMVYDWIAAGAPR